eukprot:366456-Chlamydomonas_euryale.AAC.16
MATGMGSLVVALVGRGRSRGWGRPACRGRRGSVPPSKGRPLWPLRARPSSSWVVCRGGLEVGVDCWWWVLQSRGRSRQPRLPRWGHRTVEGACSGCLGCGGRVRAARPGGGRVGLHLVLGVGDLKVPAGVGGLWTLLPFPAKHIAATVSAHTRAHASRRTPPVGISSSLSSASFGRPWSSLRPATWFVPPASPDSAGPLSHPVTIAMLGPGQSVAPPLFSFCLAFSFPLVV